MANNAARKRAPQRERSSRPSLRLYDPVLSELLRQAPDPRATVDAATVDFDAWLHQRGALVPPAGNPRPSYHAAKRVIDIFGASLALLILSPVMLATYLVLHFTTRGHAIFRQTRVGHCGRLFEMYKFRTMSFDASSTQVKVKNEQKGPIFKNRRDPRITRVGHWLRRLSIDETPQLFNVLKGTMSLVGPRPPLPVEVARYKPWQCGRLAVVPGLTCLWQVSGRCDIESFDDWARLDLWYVANQSVATDLMLLAKTPLSVLSCRGAY